MPAVAKVRALWETFEHKGALATLDFVDPDCEWVPAPELPEPQPMRGEAAIRAYLERLRAEGVRLEPSLHTCERLEDGVLVNGRLRIVSRSALSDSPIFWVYRVRDGRVTRVESYTSRSEALQAH